MRLMGHSFVSVLLVAVASSERYEVADGFFLTRRGFCSGAWNLSNHGSSACQTHHNIGGYVPISLVVARLEAGYPWSNEQDCEAGGLFRVTIGTEEGTVECKLDVECNSRIRNITQRNVLGRLTPYVADVAELMLRPANWAILIEERRARFLGESGKPLFTFLKTPRVLRRYVRRGKPLDIIISKPSAMNASTPKEIPLTLGRLERRTKTVNVSLYGTVYGVELESAAASGDAAVVSARSMLLQADRTSFRDGVIAGSSEEKVLKILAEMQSVGLYRDGRVTVFADGNSTHASFYLSEDDSIWRPAAETYRLNGKRVPLYRRVRHLRPRKFEMTLRLEKLDDDDAAGGRMGVALSGVYDVAYEFVYNESTGEVLKRRVLRAQAFPNTPLATAQVQWRLENILTRCQKMVFHGEGNVTFTADEGRTSIRFDPVVKLMSHHQQP